MKPLFNPERTSLMKHNVSFALGFFTHKVDSKNNSNFTPQLDTDDKNL